MRNFFVPTYSRSYLYLLSLTLLIFLLFNDQFMVAFLFVAVFWQLLLIVEICGVLSIYSAFMDRPMGSILKRMMLAYVIILNFIIAVASFFSAPIFDNAPGKTDFLLIFSAINILDAILLFFLYDRNVLTEKSIGDDRIDVVELAAGSVAVALIYVAGIHLWKISWPIVFSMCVFYAGHISKSFSSFLYRKPVLFDSVVGRGKMKKILAVIIILFIIGTGRTWFIIIADKMAEKDIGWCAWMPDPSMLDVCYSGNKALIRDPVLCENIIDSFWRDQCVWDVAARINDPSACGQIEDDTENYLCRLKYGFIGGLCYSDTGCRNGARCIGEVCR